MKGDYPRFKASYSQDELVEHFHLDAQDRILLSGIRGDVNRNGAAVLLKSLLYLGYFPTDLNQVPETIRAFIANQLGLLWDHTDQYPWESGTKDYHLSLIRKHTGWRFLTAWDRTKLDHQWLRAEGAQIAHTEEDLLEWAYDRLRRLRIELPAEKEIRRLVNAALHNFFQDLYARISSRLPDPVRAGLDRLLIVPENELVSPFEKLKADPPVSGVDNLKQEILKLQQLRALGVTDEIMADVPPQVLQMLKRRATNERAGEMREHPAEVRRTLMACFIYLKAKEVTDDAIRMMLEMIHRIESLTERQLEREILQDGVLLANAQKTTLLIRSQA